MGWISDLPSLGSQRQHRRVLLDALKDPLHDGSRNTHGGTLAGNVIRNSETIAEIISRACGRHEMLILVTPYLRFESSFVRNDKTEIQVAATMSREDATYGLRNAGLKMRFPNEIGRAHNPTSYLRFESSFVRNDKTEIQVAATMSREDATYGLRNAGLKMRFPN